MNRSLCGLFVLVVACDKSNGGNAQPAASTSASAEATPSGPTLKLGYDPLQLPLYNPLPAKLDHPSNPPTDEKIALGRRLFFDKRLSAGKDVSCNDCHDVGKHGDDAGKATSTGTKGAVNTRNTPTVFNAAGAHAQGWDARAGTVEDMIAKHVAEPSIMAMDEKALAAALAADAPAFRKAFPEEKTPVSAETISKAIGVYVRKLVTPSRWDRFLLGDRSALTVEEQRGLGAFMNAGCGTCHMGKYMGASTNQKLGVAKPWPTPVKDPGREGVTKQSLDKGIFKVPTLRNVAVTGPWLHDGSLGSLEETVKLMAKYQIGKDLTDADAKAIVAFLGALTGEPPPATLTARP